MKLKGVGKPTLKEKAYVFERLCSHMRWAGVSLQHEKISDAVHVMMAYNKAVSDDYNGHPVSQRQHNQNVNRLFWKVARVVCHEGEFKEEQDDI
jgi:hypothetical protein